MLGVSLTDGDVVAVFHEDLGQGKSQTVDLVDVTCIEQDTTGLVGHWHAVRQLRSRSETVQDGFFVVVTWDTLTLGENLFPLISALVIQAIKLFV